MNLQILDLHQVFLKEIKVGVGFPTYKMILAGLPEEEGQPADSLKEALHWEPVVTLPPFGLLLTSRGCLAALGLSMEYDPLVEFRSQLSTTQRHVTRQRRRIKELETCKTQQRRRIKQLETGTLALEVRMAALEQQLAGAVPKPKAKRTIAASAFNF